MPTLQELLAKKAELEKQIEMTAKRERSEAVAKVKELMAEHGLTISDLGTRSPSKSDRSGIRKVAPKYRDSATGQTWSGRGLQPNWLKAALKSGRKLEDFAL